MALALLPYPANDLDRLGDEIAELSAHLDAATARLLDLIREFDARRGWGNGFRSCAHWLNWRVGLGLGPAREKVRVARALGGLPAIAAALARGEVSYSKVRALTRIATSETEARLLAVGRAGTTEHVERIVRGWRRVDRWEESRDGARRHQARGLTVPHDEDGMVLVRGRLEPEVGALLIRALDAAREALYQRARRAAEAGEAPSVPQCQADALALVAEAALAHALDPGAPGERYQVVVHVDGAVLADPAAAGQSLVEDGARVPAETSRRLACDASVVTMRHGPDGRTLDVGRRTRTIPPARASSAPLGQRRAHQSRQPRAALPAASSRGPRGGFSGRARRGWRAPIPLAGQAAAAGRASLPQDSRGFSGISARGQCGARRPPSQANRLPELGRRAPG